MDLSPWLLERTGTAGAGASPPAGSEDCAATAARIARASAGLECAAIQARTRSTVSRLGESPRRSRATKDGLRAPCAPSTDTLVRVTGEERLDLAPEDGADGRFAHEGQHPVGGAEPERAPLRERGEEALVAERPDAEAPGAHAVAFEMVPDRPEDIRAKVCHGQERRENSCAAQWDSIV